MRDGVEARRHCLQEDARTRWRDTISGEMNNDGWNGLKHDPVAEAGVEKQSRVRGFRYSERSMRAFTLLVDPARSSSNLEG